jgi:hypothetical protein
MKLKAPSLILGAGLLLFLAKALHSQTSAKQYATPLPPTDTPSVASPHTPVLTLPARTTGLTPVEGRIKAVEPVRVPVSDTITRAETRVTLEFTLSGCLDKLIPLISHYEVQGSRATIYVTALNAHNEQSMVANCVAMPQASAQVSVPGVFGRNQIRVVFVGQRPQQNAS